MSFLLFAWSVNFQWIALPLLVAVAMLGLLALVSPLRFAQFSQSSSKWVDTAKFFEKFDKPINIDRHILRYSRIFGVAIMVACAVLGYVLSTYLS